MTSEGVLSKADLLKEMFGLRDVRLARGGFVKVRALTRAEAYSVKGREMPEDEAERVLLSIALVEPKLSEAEVKAWQEKSPAGEIEDVVNEIMRLSGMAREAPKEAYKSA